MKSSVGSLAAAAVKLKAMGLLRLLPLRGIPRNLAGNSKDGLRWKRSPIA